MEKRRIIDNRKRKKFMIDDEYINKMAKLCGWKGTIVYVSLCRHCNINQESFPSIKLLAEQHKVSRPTIIKGVAILEKRNVISVKKIRTKTGQWLNNAYILLDKSDWIYAQVNIVDMATQVNVSDQPSQRRLLDQVNDVDTKETHSEGNTYKETHNRKVPVGTEQSSDKIDYRNKDIEFILDLFEENLGIRPVAIKARNGFDLNRSSAKWLVEKYGREDTKLMLETIFEIQSKDKYCRTSVNPLEVKNNLAWYKIYFEKHKIVNRKA